MKKRRNPHLWILPLIQIFLGMVGKLLSGSTRKSFREDVFQQQAPGTYFNHFKRIEKRFGSISYLMLLGMIMQFCS